MTQTMKVPAAPLGRLGRRLTLATVALFVTLGFWAPAAHATGLNQEATHQLNASFCNAYTQRIKVAPQPDGTSVWYAGLRYDTNGKFCNNGYARARLGCFNADNSTIVVTGFVYGAGDSSLVQAVNLAPRGYCQVDSQVSQPGQPYNQGGFWQTRIYGDGQVQYFLNGQPI